MPDTQAALFTIRALLNNIEIARLGDANRAGFIVVSVPDSQYDRTAAAFEVLRKQLAPDMPSIETNEWDKQIRPRKLF